MGFLDRLGEAMQKRNEKVRRYVEMYSRMDDETLLRRWKSHLDIEQRMAMQKVLSDRGYEFSSDR